MGFLPGFTGFRSIEMTGLEGLNYPINKSTYQPIGKSTHQRQAGTSKAKTKWDSKCKFKVKPGTLNLCTGGGQAVI
jgi:hypothetical protein